MFNKATTLNKSTPAGAESRSSVLGDNRQSTLARASETQKALDSMLSSPPVPSAAQDASEPLNGSRLIVGANVKLKGAEILDCDTLVVEGRVEATMDSRVLRIARHGAFAGKVSIDVAEIHGEFEGELLVREQLIVYATGRLKGQIRYGRIQVEEGGELAGDIGPLTGSENRPVPIRSTTPELAPVPVERIPLATGTSG
ncbi:polymer-forming cytoskeletal protein [Chitinimonas arctica]|uniref:Polymer-forming cytoskeletal protein n=1 Tax=Chitinimonas arctica TaxID=2594795 RepID=A0A516SIU5_9NEIS|nr:polymer-forming cytoskeletal protein [Chitinimonas arctica]QDQ28063.1 polymer-forming cytoskeletal protein [Chitinimonas arctica]